MAEERMLKSFKSQYELAGMQISLQA